MQQMYVHYDNLAYFALYNSYVRMFCPIVTVYRQRFINSP